MKHLRTWSMAAVLCLLAGAEAMAGVVANQKGKCGYEDENGVLIVDYKYDFIGNFSEKGLALVSNSGKYGFINQSGQEVVPCVYEEIGDFQNGMAQITKSKKVGLLADDGTIVVEPKKYTAIGRFNSDGITWATTAKDPANTLSYSVIGRNGQEILPQQNYKLILPDNTKAAFPTSQSDSIDPAIKYLSIEPTSSIYWYNSAIYDMSGNVLLNNDTRENIYMEVFNTTIKKSYAQSFLIQETISEDVVILIYNKYDGKGSKRVSDNDTYTIGNIYYDLTNQRIISSFSFQTGAKAIYQAGTVDYAKSILFNASNSTSTLADKQQQAMKDVYSGDYYKLSPFNNGFARITSQQNGVKKDIVINKAGETVGEYPRCFDYANGYMVIQNEDSLYGLVDTLQNIVIPCQYQGAAEKIRENGYWAVRTEKVGVINLQNDTIVPFNYDIINVAHNGDILVGENQKWGLWKHSEEKLPCAYDNIVLYDHDACLLQDDDHYYVHNVATDNRSAMYDGCSGALAASEEHGDLLFEVYTIDTDTLYGYVNAKAELVVPCVLSKDAANLAYLYYRNLPVQEFSDIDVHRLKLRFTRRERTYGLTDIIPDEHWDY